MFEFSFLEYNRATKKVEWFIYDENDRKVITFTFKNLEYGNIHRFMKLGDMFIEGMKKNLTGFSLNEIYFIHRYLNSVVKSLQEETKNV